MEVVPHHDLSLDAARRLVQHVVGAAAAESVALTVAVVDGSGTLIAFERMDRAPRFSAQLAVAKARTAATFGNPTSELESAFHDRAVFANSFAGQGGWYFGRGGFPVRVDGELVGGIGVSGETAEREEELARRAAASLA
jgi:uncharacterized protein GlcG (DUF336 family)